MPSFGETATKHRILRHEPDRQKIFRHVQRHVRRRRVQRHERRQHRLIEPISIGRGLRGGARRQASAGARLIDHDGLLAPELREPVGREPQGHVGSAARRRIRDDLHGLVRIRSGLSVRHRNARYRQQPRQRTTAKTCFHVALNDPVSVSAERARKLRRSHSPSPRYLIACGRPMGLKVAGPDCPDPSDSIMLFLSQAAQADWRIGLYS